MMRSNPSYSPTNFIRPEVSAPQNFTFTAHDHNQDHDHDNDHDHDHGQDNDNNDNNISINNILGTSSKHTASRTSRRTRDPSQCHRCAQCSRVYARSDHLVRHLRSHSEHRLYTCSVCGKSFARKCIQPLPYKSKSMNVALLTSLGTSFIAILLCTVAPLMLVLMAMKIRLCSFAGPPRLVAHVQ